jgi:hypothetical protein
MSDLGIAQVIREGLSLVSLTVVPFIYGKIMSRFSRKLKINS